MYNLPQQNKAFTLVELLVVIAVMAVLTGMLVPALAGARRLASSIKCLSNLRQMGIAAQAYANLHDGHYPLAWCKDADPATNTNTDYAWDFTIKRDWSTTPPTITVQPGLLWQSATDMQIQQCPSFTGAANSPGDPHTGYNYNYSFIGYLKPLSAITQPNSPPRTARISDVRDPANTALFGDGQFISGANKYMRSPFANLENAEDSNFPFRAAGTQGYRHNSKTNVAWCDGRASTVSQRHTETYPTEIPNLTPQTGFLSPDNSLYDLK